VHEHVDPAACRACDLVDRAAREIGVLDVAFNQHAARAVRFDELAGLLRIASFLAKKHGHARRALGREMHGDRAAYAAVPAGDHAMPVLEPSRSDVPVANDLGLGPPARLVAGLLLLALPRETVLLRAAHLSSLLELLGLRKRRRASGFVEKPRRAPAGNVLGQR